MANFTINLDAQVRATRADLTFYQKKQLPTATQRALNKTLDSAYTITKRLLGEHIGLTQGAIGKRLFKHKAPAGGTSVTLVLKAAKAPNLASFKHSVPTKYIKGKKRLSGQGVRATAWEKRKLYPRTFIWNRNGSQTVFKRKRNAAKVTPKLGKVSNAQKYIVKRGGTYHDRTSGQSYTLKKGDIIKRQPVAAVFGPDLAQVFEQTLKGGTSIHQQLTDQIYVEFDKKLAHEINRISEEQRRGRS